jgi:hypothetical protein
MKAKEKAKGLINDFFDVKNESIDYGMEWQMAQQCALICVDEIVNSIVITDLTTAQNQFNYWEEVKKEINLS